MTDRLKSKVAVVTGAASRGEGVGNGMATAILFAREGAKVVLVNRGRTGGDVGHADPLRGRRGRGVRSRRRGAGRRGGDGRLHDETLRPRSTSCTITSASARLGTPETMTLAGLEQRDPANLTSTMLCTGLPAADEARGGGAASIKVSSIAGASA